MGPNWTPDNYRQYWTAKQKQVSDPNFNFTDPGNEKWAAKYEKQTANLRDYGNKTGMSQKTQSILSGAGSLLGGISGSDLSEGDKAVREGIRGGIGALGPWGAAISAASGVVDAVGDWTGTNLGNIDMGAAERAGVKGGATFNKIMNMIPGNSMLWGMFGDDTNTAHLSAEAMAAAGGYGGAFQKLQDAQALGSQRMLFGKNKTNKYINETNNLNNTLTNMALDAKRMESNYAPQLIAANNQMIYDGYTPGLSLKRHGGTIPELEKVRSIMQSLQSKEQEIVSEDPQKFQLGGKMNMIVTGALHARKHDLEELNPVLEGNITKKGIPVVVMDDGGEVINQTAEVEEHEIILASETTKTVEDYYKEFNDAESKSKKDKIALECGKYLVTEILKNTDDPDKLIKKTV